MIDETNMQNFSGIVPLFPLSNVVLFPHVVLPLHIFEKRYQKLLIDAMEGEKMIGMAVLKPGWESNYEGNPDIYSHACLGKIVQHEPLENGRSNILLLGLKRVLIKDILSPRPYRKAKVEIMHDKPKQFDPPKLNALHERLLKMYGEIVVEYARSKRQFPTISTLDVSINQLTDIIAASIGLRVEDQVALLQESDALRRADILITKMDQLLKTGGPTILNKAKPDFFPTINLN